MGQRPQRLKHSLLQMCLPFFNKKQTSISTLNVNVFRISSYRGSIHFHCVLIIWKFRLTVSSQLYKEVSAWQANDLPTIIWILRDRQIDLGQLEKQTIVLLKQSATTELQVDLPSGVVVRWGTPSSLPGHATARWCWWSVVIQSRSRCLCPKTMTRLRTIREYSEFRACCNTRWQCPQVCAVLAQ